MPTPEPSAFLKIMVFAAIMNGSSNVIAQAITAYKAGVCLFSSALTGAPKQKDLETQLWSVPN